MYQPRPIVTSIERPDPARWSRFSETDVADLSDAMDNMMSMAGIRCISAPGGRLVGPAVTVACPNGGVNLVKLGADLAQSGDVLVIATRANSGAVVGGNLSQVMYNSGLAGVVIDGNIRDADDIRRTGLAVFARGEATPAVQPEAAGFVNVPVSCGGVVVTPGDVIVADANGVVVIPPHTIERVLEGYERIHALHESWADDITRGRMPGITEIKDQAIGAAW